MKQTLRIRCIIYFFIYSHHFILILNIKQMFNICSKILLQISKLHLLDYLDKM